RVVAFLRLPGRAASGIVKESSAVTVAGAVRLRPRGQPCSLFIRERNRFRKHGNHLPHKMSIPPCPRIGTGKCVDFRATDHRFVEKPAPMFVLLACLALLAEAAIGYPDRLFRAVGHPVTWIGRLIAILDSRLNDPARSAATRRAGGIIAVVILILAAGV